MVANSQYNQIADRWIACWNEKDPTIRRKLIDELWAEDGGYYNRLFICEGRDMVEAAVATAHDEYFSKGFVFKSSNDAYGHHNGFKFSWVMVTASTGEVDTFGDEFIILNDDGQITHDYQFGVRAPSI